jgi:lambda family phage portal protein
MPKLPEVKLSLLDRAAKALSPQWGLNRIQSKMRFAALGNAGFVVPGSRRKSMKGVTATANSPDADTIGKLTGTRALSRDLYMNSPLATSILRRHKILSIGSGLQVQSTIDREYLDISQEAARKYEKTFEREFDLWAESFNSDFDGNLYYGDNQALGYLNLLLNGDFFFMPVWRAPYEKGFPYELTIKMIDADLVRNPIGHQYAHVDVKGGVEKDASGRVVAYHVWDSYPNEVTPDGSFGKSQRVTVFDDDGRQQIYHVFDPERISQRRGIPLLANSADSLKQMTRLSEAELMSALVASFFTAFVRDSSGMGALMGPALTPEETEVGGGRYAPDEAEVGARNLEDGNDLQMGHGNIVYLDEQKDITVAEPVKSDKEFGAFWKSLAIPACASGNIPIEQALMNYETSYTAARAAANDVWEYRKVARTLMNRRMNIPVYSEWMQEAIIRNRVQAPGFFDDYATRRAWLRSGWVGSGQGSMDPFREAKASVIHLNSYDTTHEDEYARNHGGRWDVSVTKRANEEMLLEEAGLVNKPDPEELVGPDGQEDEDERNEASQNN